MNMIIEPAVFLINKKDWNKADERQLFIDQLTRLFEKVKDYSFVKIAWLDEMLSAIWENKDFTAWLTQPEYRNLLFEPFIKFLSFVETFENEFPDCGTISPEIEVFNDEIQRTFYSAVHAVMSKTDNSLIYPNYKQSEVSCEYAFSCDNHGQIRLRSMDSLNKWSSEIDFCNDYFWPISEDDESIYRFKTAIKMLANLNNSEILYQSYSFSPEFIRDIHKKIIDRNKLLKALSMRLSMNQKAASDNKSLNDEPLRKTDNQIRRFRVDQKRRIHYKYDDLGSIRFLAYDDKHRNVL